MSSTHQNYPADIWFHTPDEENKTITLVLAITGELPPELLLTKEGYQVQLQIEHIASVQKYKTPRWTKGLEAPK